MSMILALCFVARAEPPAEEPASAEQAVQTPPTGAQASRKAARQLARRLTDRRGRLNRTELCLELVPKADEVDPSTLVQLKQACPSWFPVPAPPTFCRIDPCVTDVEFDDARERTATAPR